MSASTVLSVIAPVSGAAPSPSAAAAEDLSAEFAAMVSDSGQGDQAPPSGGNASPAASPAATPKVEPPKAASLIDMIDASEDVAVEEPVIAAEIVAGPADTESDAPPKADVSEAKDAAPTADAADPDAGLVLPVPVAAAQSVSDPAEAATGETAPVAAPPVDSAAPGPEAPVETSPTIETPSAKPVAPAPVPAAAPEPLKAEAVRLAAVSRDGASKEMAADTSSPTTDAPGTASPPASTGTHSAAQPSPAQITLKALAADPAVRPVAEAAATAEAASMEGPVQAANAEGPAPAHAEVAVSTLSRATVETTIQIAARIVRQLEAKQTRFDMVLTPEDLGRVEVSLDIDADGQLAARLAFDNPAAAADLRGRADELRRQLTDAGFQLAGDSLEFSERDANAFSGGAFERGQDRAFSFAGGKRLGDQADLAAAAPAAWINLSLTPDRVDMRV